MVRKNILYGAGKSRQNKNLLYRHDKPNEPTREGPLSFRLHSPQFHQSAGATPI